MIYYNILSIEDLDGELWKPVLEYEDYYMVSNKGRIKALDRIWICGNRGSTRRSCSKILKQSIVTGGYLGICLTKDGKKKTHQLHQLIANVFLPKIQGKNIINHKNGIKSDNRLENLEWCNHSENTRHAFANGLNKAHLGSEHGGSILNDDDVLYIRSVADKVTTKELSLKYAVNPATIRNVILRKSWKHI